MAHKRILRVVVASPSDVQAERDTLPAVVMSLIGASLLTSCTTVAVTRSMAIDFFKGCERAGNG